MNRFSKLSRLAELLASLTGDGPEEQDGETQLPTAGRPRCHRVISPGLPRIDFRGIIKAQGEMGAAQWTTTGTPHS